MEDCGNWEELEAESGNRWTSEEAVNKKRRIAPTQLFGKMSWESAKERELWPRAERTRPSVTRVPAGVQLPPVCSQPHRDTGPLDCLLHLCP
jgi:hypothetical protein